MATHLTSLQSTVARAPDVGLFRLTTSRSILARERMVDQALDESFPASDPPPWTLGTTTGRALERTDATSDDGAVWSSHATVVLPGGKRTAGQWIAAGVGAIGMGMFVPIAILAIGTPIVLAARTLIEVAAWLVTGFFN